MIIDVETFVIGVIELLVLIALPLYLGYRAGGKLLEGNRITSGWGIVVCVVFLYFFSNLTLGDVGLFIGFVVWGIILSFAEDKLKYSGLV